jgi:predicted anti-sigma-YlaC factor YlaD
MGQGLTCKELVEIITDYLEGALTPPERMHFEDHLKSCSGCTQYLEQMKQTIRLTGMLTLEQISPEAKAELLGIFRDWRKE